ncbi:hypothetical protein BDK51DRAFT_38948 [Blyttiomyces helicus]|uniref:Uncharacterized protein n=1 Tax=Blyttiomyces helicus TaxID=388810 RepID=A0A4P9W780_9FUNG|nr:hypothetical protein BDK51DRAFT_38948 [Blyttiomyces helicus]|eukprot:RKO88319.1 hypothetical protein BDK51DRAFT_38948 [Blyttiomyces helicus]
MLATPEDHESAAADAIQRDDWRAAADSLRAAYTAQPPTSKRRSYLLFNFTMMFIMEKVRYPIAGDLTFIVASSRATGSQPPLEAHCAYAIGILMDSDGRYRRGIATAESASEADRRVIVMYHDGDKPAGELLDKFLETLRQRLAKTLQQISTMNPSAIPDEISRLPKIATATRTRECRDWRASADAFRAAYDGASPDFAPRSYCIWYYTHIFHDGPDTLLQPTACDLAFMRGIFESDAAPIPHRVLCGYTLCYLRVRKGDCKKSGETARCVIALAEYATVAEGSAAARPDGKGESIGELLDSYLVYLRVILAETTIPDCTVPFAPAAPGDAAYKQRLTDTILERAFFEPGHSCDKCKTSSGTMNAAEGRIERILEFRGPEPGDRWRVALIGADAGTSDEIVDSASMRLVVPCSERDELVGESLD